MLGCEYGAHFAGSEVFKVVCDDMNVVCKELFDVAMPLGHCYSVEENPGKRNFMVHAHNPSRVYETTKLVGRPRALNTVTNLTEFVPWAFLGHGGPTCVSRSHISVRSSEFVGCVELGEGKTGHAFSEFIIVCSIVRYKIILCENLKALLEKNKGALTDCESDGEFVVIEFRKHEYAVRWFEVQALHYGSLPSRPRIYLVGYDGLNNEYKLDLVETALTCMKFVHPSESPLFDNHFLLTPSWLDALQAWPKEFLALDAGVGPEQAAKKAKTAKPPVYMAEHLEFYHDAGFEWPPTEAQMRDPIWQHVTPYVSPRAFQVAFFCAMKFPDRIAEEEHGFIDINFNMRLLLNTDKLGKLKSPWSPHPGCLLSTTILLMRTLPGTRIDYDAKVPIWRQWLYRIVCGVELMSMVGWCHTKWGGTMPEWAPHELLTDLAGNAYSAFAVGPVLISAMAAYAMPPPPAPQASDEIVVSDSADERGSSSGSSG